jgi:hypothetical protein
MWPTTAPSSRTLQSFRSGSSVGWALLNDEAGDPGPDRGRRRMVIGLMSMAATALVSTALLWAFVPETSRHVMSSDADAASSGAAAIVDRCPCSNFHKAEKGW